jgi:hypothetical protein
VDETQTQGRLALGAARRAALAHLGVLKVPEAQRIDPI